MNILEEFFQEEDIQIDFIKQLKQKKELKSNKKVKL